ncbi:DivIVA domain-containing protein [Stackebrandtia soli]|uniref:DivIVA domain-containing protein n=1 Tax=Stackebrandtia soli TaxID=1892856 RepID=UPI0039EB7A74
MEFVLVALALVLAAGVAFAVVVFSTGDDPGLVLVTVDGLPADLPSDRPLTEADVAVTRFDTGARGYRTGQVDAAMTRLAYDIGFKDELVRVLAAEVAALREGRTSDADDLRDSRRKALGDNVTDPVTDEPGHVESADDERDASA